jgi:hypothetical protein
MYSGVTQCTLAHTYEITFNQLLTNWGDIVLFASNFYINFDINSKSNREISLKIESVLIRVRTIK